MRAAAVDTAGRSRGAAAESVLNVHRMRTCIDLGALSPVLAGAPALCTRARANFALGRPQASIARNIGFHDLTSRIHSLAGPETGFDFRAREASLGWPMVG